MALCQPEFAAQVLRLETLGAQFGPRSYEAGLRAGSRSSSDCGCGQGSVGGLVPALTRRGYRQGRPIPTKTFL